MIIYDDDVTVTEHEDDDNDDDDDDDDNDDDDDDDDNETTKFMDPDICHVERAVAKRRKVPRFSFFVSQYQISWCYREVLQNIYCYGKATQKKMQHGYSLAI